MIELTTEQCQELDSGSLRALDPRTQKTFVLVSEEVYERLQDLLAGPGLSPAEQRALLNAAALRAGWDDPEMDIYDKEEEPGQP